IELPRYTKTHADRPTPPPQSRRFGVTIMPRVSSIDELSSPRGEGGNREAPCSKISLESGPTSTSVKLSKTALELGVLIGRSARCVGDGLSSVLGNSISRAHVLLLRDGKRDHAYDLCSTNGTFSDGQPFCSGVLSNKTSLSLGSGPDSVQLSWAYL